MKRLRRALLILRATAAATYKEWAAYRSHSLVSALVGPVYFLVQVSIWRAVLGDGGELGGMGLDQMLRYYGVTTLISYLIMDFADWNLQMLIHTGKFTTFALRPMHHRFFALSQKLGHRVLGFLFEFLPVLAIFTFIFRIRLIPASWPWFLLSLAFGFLIQFYINYIIGLAGFWLVKTGGIRSVVHIVTSICSGALFPLAMLPSSVQGAAFFLPFQYTLYVPGMVFTGAYQLGAYSMDIPSIVAVQGVYLVALALMSELVYRRGMKKYTAVGA